MGRGALTLSFRKFLIFLRLPLSLCIQVQDVCTRGSSATWWTVARKCHILQALPIAITGIAGDYLLSGIHRRFKSHNS